MEDRRCGRELEEILQRRVWMVVPGLGSRLRGVRARERVRRNCLGGNVPGTPPKKLPETRTFVSRTTLISSGAPWKWPWRYRPAELRTLHAALPPADQALAQPTERDGCASSRGNGLSMDVSQPRHILYGEPE